MASLGQDIKEFLENEKDIEFEEEISRNPYRLKSWWRYLLAKEGAKPKTRNIIHERALKFLPNRLVWFFPFSLSSRFVRDEKERVCVLPGGLKLRCPWAGQVDPSMILVTVAKMIRTNTSSAAAAAVQLLSFQSSVRLVQSCCLVPWGGHALVCPDPTNDPKARHR